MVITELGVERKKAKREIFLTLKALESDPSEKDTDLALLATRIIRATKRGGHLAKKLVRLKAIKKIEL